MNPFGPKKKDAHASMAVPANEQRDANTRTPGPIERRTTLSPSIPLPIPQKKMMKVLFSEEAYDALMANASVFMAPFRFENNKTRLALTERLFLKTAKNGSKFTVSLEEKTLEKVVDALSVIPKHFARMKQLEEENFKISKENQVLLESEKGLLEKLSSIEEVYLGKMSELEEKLSQTQEAMEEAKLRLVGEKSHSVDEEKKWLTENEELKHVQI